jgi:hypothetical protein
MADGDGLERAGVADASAEPIVTAHGTAPGRTVLTERGNADAWIASDLTVDADR